ncbi:protein of unknown function [Dyella sp. OK004]|uniref:DUF4160 domain-containing protein n=1 Tax=Dyella sp. OK004 TaxID=1855292 RepID=UPI0008E54DDA|nr:DUF4160 domain-containing protein [Dyella sp. OK004]SFS11789.1 protein of unknown function [Dyella sp. OK004]
MADLETLIKSLQRDLALSDLFSRTRNGGPDVCELSLLLMDRMKIKMYQEKGHAMPHVHVDYGRDSHVASFAIDVPRLLEGDLGRHRNATVIEFISDHREELLSIWRGLQAGANVAPLVVQLRADAE